jgi:hypothetical protein
MNRRTLAKALLIIALGLGARFALADLVVNYTLKTATLQSIKEVSVYRSGGSIMVSATYEIKDENGIVRIPNGFVDGIALTPTELSTLVTLLSGPVLTAVNDAEGL